MVDAEREKIENIKEEIGLLENRLNTDKINSDLKKLDIQFQEASSAKTKIEDDRQRELNLLKEEYSVDNTILNSLKDRIDNKKNERDNENKLKGEAIEKKSEIKGGLFSGAGALRGRAGNSGVERVAQGGVEPQISAH